MACKNFVHIFCSKKDAIVIRAKFRCLVSNVQLNLTAVYGNLSTKKIIYSLKKQRNLNSGDCIFFISESNVVAFKNDFASEMVFQFQNIEEFFNWLNDQIKSSTKKT